MEPETTAFDADAAVVLPAAVTVAIGNDSRIFFDADPLDGTIGIIADEGVNLEFDVAEFALLAELLLRAAMAD